MSRIIITLSIFLFFSQIVHAHDSSEHTSDLEMIIAGIGLVFIIGACIHTLWWNYRHQAQLIEYDSFVSASDAEDNKL